MDIEVTSTLRLPLAEHTIAKHVADAELRSLNNLYRVAIREYLRQRLHLAPKELRGTLQPDCHQE